jgi:phosphopantetheinyl transferase
LSSDSLADVIQPIDWVTSASGPAPHSDNQFHLWYLDQSKIPLHEAWLAADEIERAERMQPDRRSEFVSGRNALRWIIASLLGMTPEMVVIRISETGKPYLDDNAIDFSFSHCSKKLLLGFARYPMGIDLEQSQSKNNIMRIAQRLFDERSCELLDDADGEARQELFFRFWTSHEAVQKIRGDGIFGDRHLPGFVGSFRLPGFQGAIATSCTTPEFIMHEALPG